LYGSISQFPSVIGLLLTGFIADRLGVENIFIIGGVAISINISYPYIRIKEEKSPITIDYQRLFFFFSDPPGGGTLYFLSLIISYLSCCLSFSPPISPRLNFFVLH